MEQNNRGVSPQQGDEGAGTARPPPWVGCCYLVLCVTALCKEKTISSLRRTIIIAAPIRAIAMIIRYGTSAGTCIGRGKEAGKARASH